MIPLHLTRAELDALIDAATRTLDEAANHRSDLAGPALATLDLIDATRKLEAAARKPLLAA